MPNCFDLMVMRNFWYYHYLLQFQGWMFRSALYEAAFRCGFCPTYTYCYWRGE